jgi:hypothetical protein
MTARHLATTRTALLALSAVSLLGGLWLVLANRTLRQHGGGAGKLTGWWPLPLPRGNTGTAGAHHWWAPAVTAGLAVVLLVMLGWLVQLAVRGTRRRTPLALAGPRLSLDPDALAAAMRAQVEAVSGVDGARVVLDRAGRVPLARITVFLDQCSDPRAVLRALEEGPLPHARAALAPTPVRTEIRFRARSRRTRRVR